MARTVPVMATEVPGNFVTGALWNAQVGGLGNFTLAPPRFKGYQTSNQSIATGQTDVAVLLDSEEYDSESGHSTTTNTSRYTVQVAGTYRITATASFAGNATGNRKLGILVNGVNIRGGGNQGPGITTNSWAATVSAEVALLVGDYVEMGVWQTSGAALATNASAGGNLTPVLSAHWISQ